MMGAVALLLLLAWLAYTAIMTIFSARVVSERDPSGEQAREAATLPGDTVARDAANRDR